ncbi:AAA family ATPase [Beggiatoa leptomitoformis]|uniref:AAA family ATPase n=1 Tax=Beggiatoa leptomitoformis TaxID=288004 RepID=A0A2N9Y9Z1_9GAMM|nr:AAA family ATPase [Beggiatoa leptomitoformis]ALG67285.1 AAA family ATPase [Beggiatoa leptomitoformis]AUI67286.1 AAA family ATPase [Beggiatoa leptomitoformis]
MLNLPNYQVQTQIYESANSVIYRGARNKDNLKVILKVLKEDYPSPEELMRYRQEYEITRCLDQVDGVVKAYSLEKLQNTLVIVLEDFGGESLKHLIVKRRLTVQEFLPLAIQIADSLDHLYADHIIHKDINPANIVWNPETNQLKIIDFGIASRLPRENPTLKSPEQLEGTLAYLSPEQTGRMNRVLDYRTDLYSLGITFYELLTGQLPFTSTDLLEVIHGHIAKRPEPVCQINADVPPILSDIIIKLMAKNAEDRYQSAFGVKHDLQVCLAHIEHLTHFSFGLAQQDISGSFHLPQKLYGREAEIHTLWQAFERVSQGTAELLLIAGYSGIGKTALVQEIYKPITAKRGYFCAGKFDQLQRNIPYSALIQSFRQLIQQLLTESSVPLECWQQRLLAAVGCNGQVISDVIPEIELLLGKLPPVSPLPPTEAQNRFNFVFQNFIRACCQVEHPLVIFLDDLQWADSASLKLMSLMMSDIPYLFLIGAYRDNEVNATHPLLTTLNELQKTSVTIQTVTLTPLGLPHIVQFLADTLNLKKELSTLAKLQGLAELLLEKTGGNPFFLGEFIKTLYTESLLQFDCQKRAWVWDLTQIQARNITDNVVELMGNKVKQLQPTTQHILKLAACLGNTFELVTLAKIAKKSISEVQIQLWQALTEGMIITVGNTYKFIHDRVQQSIYALIPEAEKPALHWTIGQLLLQDSTATENRLFEVVDHLNIGLHLLTEKDKSKIAQLNLLAGKRAKMSAAFDAALKYCVFGLQLLEQDTWKTHYNFTLELHSLAAEMASLIGDFKQLDVLFTLITKHAKTPVDMASAYESKIHGYMSEGKLQETLDTALEILNRLGLALPSYPDDEAFQTALRELQARYTTTTIEDLVNLPEMLDKTKLAIMRVVAKSTAAAYIGRPKLFLLLILRQVDLSITHGNTSESAYVYACYALLLCGVTNDLDTGYRFGQLATKLLEKSGDTKFKSKTLEVVNGHVWHFKQALKDTLPNLEIGYQSGLETGDLEYAGYNAFFYSCNAYFAGTELQELARQMTCYNDGMQRIRAETGIRWQSSFRQAVFNLLGQAESLPQYLDGQAFNQSQMLPLLQNTNNQSALAAFYVNTLILCYLFDDYEKALENATLAEQHKGGMFAMVSVPVANFYESLTCLQVYTLRDAKHQTVLLNKVIANQQQLKHFADHAPMNHLHKFLLVEAELARVLGNRWKAMQDYENAIQNARENDYIQEQALAYELAARFYLMQGMDKFAQTYLQEARYHYQQWGALAKVSQLEAKYPQWLTAKTAPVIPTIDSLTSTATVMMSTRTRIRTSNWLDLESVMKATQALSGEMVLSQLLEKMMHIVIENAGAERGLLILKQDGQWLIEAEGAFKSEEVTVLQSLPIEGRTPTAIINYVMRTREAVVLANARQEGMYVQNSYVQQQQLKSVLCNPIIHQGKMMGILYLENNVTEGAFTPARLKLLEMLSSQAAISLENALLYRTLEQKVEIRTAQLAAANQQITALNEQLKAENLRMGAELSVARQLQQMVLPREEELRQIEALDIACFMEPAVEVGGDYYEILNHDGRVKIGIGDVTGHGLESGVLMLMVQTTVRALLLAGINNPKEFLNIVNQTIYQNAQRMQTDKNLTLSLLDYHDGKLQLTGQHEEVLLVRKNGHIERIDTLGLGFMVGMEADISPWIAQREIQLESGDGIVLYTDGITEARNVTKTNYDIQRLCTIVSRYWHQSAAEIQQAVIADVRQHIGKQNIADDITLLVLKQR